jgi:hypothetical protein
MEITSDYRQDGYQKGLVEGKRTENYIQKIINFFISEKRAPVIESESESESDSRMFCSKCDSRYANFIGLCPKCGSGYTQVI